MNELSEKETQLLELIKISTEKVTVKLIEEKLSKSAVRALGKLLGKELIEATKDRANADSSYGKKMIKYYKLKVKKEE